MEQYTTLTDEEWEDILSYWEYKHYKKGEFMTKIGQVEKWFYFVAKGVARGYFEQDGQEMIAGFTYDGDYSGAYDSFLTQTPTEWHMQTITDCDMLRIHYDDLMLLFNRHKSMERWGRKFMEHIVIGFGRRQMAVLNFTAEERFLRLLGNAPQLFQMVPQKYLASYLAMTPETFSRLRRKVMQKG